ncbi:slr0305 protein [Hibiscus syriacus]|uniref:Slr0305 protein n=1 Tax=Hibiscus syriacus TaxID=106335 RepID=A0A6A2ZHB8_HIBSY|nr:slr0305 protein [Hibiscus syriacus]
MGQFYCLHCDRYFANSTVRDEHFKTKRHKKRMKQMSGPAPHTQLDAELAAGMVGKARAPDCRGTLGAVEGLPFIFLLM